jgi:hypothetical protein
MRAGPTIWVKKPVQDREISTGMVLAKLLVKYKREGAL